VLEHHESGGGEEQRLAVLVEDGGGVGAEADVGDGLAEEGLHTHVRVDVVDADVSVLRQTDHLLPTVVDVHLQTGGGGWSWSHVERTRQMVHLRIRRYVAAWSQIDVL